MSQTSLARRRDLRIIRRFGAGLKATLRQNNSVLSGLYLQGATLTGATSIRCVSGEGSVVRGAILSVSGVSGVHTVQETAQAVNGQVTLTIAPALEGPASDGAAVTFSQSFGEWSYPVMDGSGIAEVDKEIVGGRQIRVLAYQPGKPAPRHNDELDGLPITGVDVVGNPPTRYRLTVTPP